MRETVARIGKPVIALFGALVFVSLLMVGGERASTIILRRCARERHGRGLEILCPFLGALGSFFPGLQRFRISPLRNSGFHRRGYWHGSRNTARLAIRRSAMGNPICIHNIVVRLRVRSANVEGGSIKQAFSVILYGIILAAAVVPL
jgi:lactate permease